LWVIEFAKGICYLHAIPKKLEALDEGFIGAAALCKRTYLNGIIHHKSGFYQEFLYFLFKKLVDELVLLQKRLEFDFLLAQKVFEFGSCFFANVEATGGAYCIDVSHFCKGFCNTFGSRNNY